MDVILEMNNVTKNYGNNTVLKETSFFACSGDIVGLIGENGSGKTTLLNSIAGIISYTGAIKVCGEQLNDKNDYYGNLGIAFDSLAFYSHLSAADNLKVLSYDNAQIEEVLKTCGLSESKNKKVSAFSLGMRQRLNIARSIIGSPRLVIMDEPINGLDPKAILEFKQYMTSYVAENNAALLISSHALKELAYFCNKYIFLKKGRIIEILSDYDNRVEEFNAYICFNDESERKRIIDQFEQHAQEYLIVDSLSRIYFKTNDPIQIAGQETVLLMQNQSPLENIFVSL